MTLSARWVTQSSAIASIASAAFSTAAYFAATAVASATTVAAAEPTVAAASTVSAASTYETSAPFLRAKPRLPQRIRWFLAAEPATAVYRPPTPCTFPGTTAHAVTESGDGGGSSSLHCNGDVCHSA